MEQVNFRSSMKNIPQCSKKEYIMKLTYRVELLIFTMRWAAAFYLGIIEPPEEELETYGFKTNKAPPIIPQLQPLENGLIGMISNIIWRPGSNQLQKKMKEDIKKIRKDDKLYIASDKTTNFYRTDVNEYNKLKKRNIEKDYKTSSENEIDKVTKEDRKIAEKFKLENRIYKTPRRESFTLFKDHKDNFANRKETRLINPCKPELGKISKQILEKLVIIVKKATGFKQWKNTWDVIKWFKAKTGKQNFTFIQFDICEFYPSITEKLLKDTFEWVSTVTPINDDQKEVIFHARKNFMFDKNRPWVKKGDKNFDVPMGSFDSAEVSELVGLFLLSKLQNLPIDVGLYRDDGLALSNLDPSETEDVKKKICEIFDQYKLKVKIEANKKIVQYLDVTLSLDDGSYKPYTKENSKPLYVHKQSNHPPAVKKNIPLMVNKRLSMLSSSEDMFNNSSQIYQEALKNAGYEHILKYEKINIDDVNEGKKNKRKRHKHEFWFNPPHNDNVQTPVGRNFLELLDSEIPPELEHLFNRNTVRVSYSNMPNMSKIIANHNIKLLNKKAEEEKQQQQQNQQQQQQQQQTRRRGRNQQQNQQNPQQQAAEKKKDDNRPCNCRGGPQNCPLGGRCLAEKSVVYCCKVTRLDNNTSEFYTGLTEGAFKYRLYGHNSDMKKKKKKKGTMLSKHVWWLKDNGVQYNLEWSILGKARGFNPVSRICRLCLLEKYFILYKPECATLNSRDEFFTPCRHRWKHVLKNG